jgi:hypothetical protein
MFTQDDPRVLDAGRLLKHLHREPAAGGPVAGPRIRP